MIESAPIKGVIFDLDGTLYYLRKTRVRLTISLWRWIGVIRHVGSARSAVRHKTYRDKSALQTAFAEELGRRAKMSAEEAGRWYEEVFFKTFVELLDRKAKPRPGLLPFLGELKSRGVKLAVVSDLGRVDERLKVLGISPEAFDVTLCSEACGELKPSPTSFLSVAQQWGIDPRNIVVVGDRVDRDAHAATAAAMQCIIIDNHAPTRGHRRVGSESLLSWNDASRAIVAGVGIQSG